MQKNTKPSSKRTQKSGKGLTSHQERGIIKLYVGSLPGNTQKKHLKAYLSDFGKIKDLQLIKNKKTKKCAGFAFVGIKLTSNPLKKAQFESKKFPLFLGRKIKIEPFLSGKKLQDHTNEHQKRRVFVTGLPEGLDDHQLAESFKRFGELESAYRVKVESERRGTNYGYVTFKRQNALEAIFLAKIGEKQGVKNSPKNDENRFVEVEVGLKSGQSAVVKVSRFRKGIEKGFLAAANPVKRGSKESLLETLGNHSMSDEAVMVCGDGDGSLGTSKIPKKAEIRKNEESGEIRDSEERSQQESPELSPEMSQEVSCVIPVRNRVPKMLKNDHPKISPKGSKEQSKKASSDKKRLKVCSNPAQGPKFTRKITKITKTEKPKISEKVCPRAPDHLKPTQTAYHQYYQQSGGVSEAHIASNLKFSLNLKMTVLQYIHSCQRSMNPFMRYRYRF